MEYKTIGELIKRLREIEKEHGEDCRVLVSQTRLDEIDRCNVVSVGKANQKKIVTRGGVPCVVIGSYE